jgi:hypothetical protein
VDLQNARCNNKYKQNHPLRNCKGVTTIKKLGDQTEVTICQCVCGYKTGNWKNILTKDKHQNERTRLAASLLYTILQKRNG